jgi:hypothetical protein
MGRFWIRLGPVGALVGTTIAAVAVGAAVLVAGGATSDGHAALPATAAPVGVPLSFERNVGQADRDVRFLAHGPRGTLYLTPTEAVVALLPVGDRAAGPDVLRMRLLGGAPDAAVRGGDRLRGTANYLVGDRPSDWKRGIPTYGRVTYDDVYRGIDLKYHSTSGQLEYDFDVAPGADPRAIGLQLSGARSVRLDRRGRLLVRLAHRTLVQEAPVVYQKHAGARRSVTGRYELHGKGRVGFAVGAYDRSKPLVIDPKIAYSTYFGGSGNDVGTSIAVDRAGNAYVAGSTSSANLRLKHPVQRRNAGRPIDAFVAKLDPSGDLVYATYLGGGAYTDARGIALDRDGRAYVTGATGSHDFPTRHAVQAEYGGGPYDAYVTKLDRSGRGIVYSTFNGGPRNDRGYAIAVDAQGAAVSVGRTAHDGFLGVGPLKLKGEGGAFVTKFAPSGRKIVYSTVLGGKDGNNSSNTAFGVALDAKSNAYVTGITAARDFPTVGAIQESFKGGGSNAFVTKISARGRAILYSTNLGGSGEDEGIAIAVDPAGAAYVTGHTTSRDFPTSDAPLLGSSAGDGADAFVAKLHRDGSRAYAVYLGGSGDDAGNAITVDSGGHAIVAGTTSSPDFPTAYGAIQSRLGGATDAFLTVLSTSGSSWVTSTYLGGSGAEKGLGVALDRSGSTYVTGQTDSPDFPLSRPIMGAPSKRAESLGGGGSAFVTRISPKR